MNYGNNNYTLLIEKLDGFIRKYYKNHLLRGSILFFSLALLFYIAVITLIYTGEFDVVIRSVLFWSYLTVNAFILIQYIVIPLLHLYRIGKVISNEQAAVIIGKHFNEIKDKLLNVLQLKDQELETKNRHTRLLIEATIDQKAVALKPVPFTAAVNLKENRRYIKYALAPVFLIVLLFFASPSIVTEGTERLIRYNQRFEKKMPFEFHILNKELSVPMNDDFELIVNVSGNILPDEVFIAGDNDVHHRMKKKDRNTFSMLFTGVNKNIPFRLYASEFYSHDYLLTVLPKPLIMHFSIDLFYPPYLGKKPETVENTGDLILPAGTKAVWNFNTSNTQLVNMLFSDTLIAIRPVEKNIFSYSKRVFKNESYSITVSNDLLKNNDTISYLINIIPDMYPSITMEEAADSTSGKRLFFTGIAKDDYGLTRLTFNFRQIGNANDNNETGTEETGHPMKSIELPVTKNSVMDQYFYLWDLSEMELKPGRQMEYFFEVWDNDGVNGRKSTRTQTKIFKVPTAAELAERAQRQNESVKSNLTESIRQAQEIRKDIEELSRKMLEKKSVSWEEKKKLQDLLQKQKELKQNIEQIKKENENSLSRQEEFNPSSQEIMEKQQKLQELFDKVMTDDMKQLMQDLERTLDQIDKSKLQEMLDKMNLSTKDIEKELDRNLELFKQLEFEQNLSDLTDHLKELSEQQQKLAEQTENKKQVTDSLKSKQDELNKQFDDIRKDISDLNKKNKELENPNKMEDTKNEEEEISQDMQNSSDQMDKNKPKKAAESQKSAAQKMKKMNEQFQNMLAGMSAPSEDMNALRQILDNLVQLSFDQEELMQNLEKTNAADPKYVQYMQRQKNLEDDSKMIEDSLQALSKRVMQIEPVINREISAINMNMEKAIQALVGRNIPEARNRQQFTMTSVNNLALLLSEALQQMQQQAASQMPGSGQCNKPGGKGVKPSLSTLRKLQEDLQKQLQQAKDGEKPGGKEGNKNMSEGLARMAAQQEYIRNELRKLADEGKPSGDPKGNLQNLMKMMEQNETDIVNRQITQETLMRQKEIETRLLEAEKALREREWDNQRQATEAKKENYSNLFQNFKYKYLKKNEDELLKTVPPSLNPFYKNKVTEYFNNL